MSISDFPAPIPLMPMGKLASALAKAQKALKSPTKGHKVDYKDKSGRDIKYSYADLADCIEALKEPLADNGLSYVQVLGFKEYGKDLFYGLTTILMHESGEWVESFHPLPMPGSTKPQEFGSALTYARRYSVSAISGMASEEDDDGALASKGMDTEKKTQNKKTEGEPAKNDKKVPQQSPPALRPDEFVMPVGSDGIKGKKLGELPTNVLGQILAGAEQSLAKTPDDKRWKLIKANVELVIQSKSKKEQSKEPDLDDLFPRDEAQQSPDVENHSQEEKPAKPDPGEYVVPADFGVDKTKGKALKSIPESDLRKIVKNIDLELRKIPPPQNLSGLFDVRLKIVEFLHSMDLKV